MEVSILMFTVQRCGIYGSRLQYKGCRASGSIGLRGLGSGFRLNCSRVGPMPVKFAS